LVLFYFGERLHGMTSDGQNSMAVIEYEEFFFCFWPFVNTQEILELPVKLNNPVITDFSSADNLVGS
jgi:hypothetical protein